MVSRRELCGFLARRLAVLVLVLTPVVAGAAEPDPRLTQNPALGRIAAKDPAEAQRLLDAIDQVMRQPAPPPMRGSVSPGDNALLEENPLLGQAFDHDPAAAVDLLKRVKEAGGGRRQ